MTIWNQGISIYFFGRKLKYSGPTKFQSIYPTVPVRRPIIAVVRITITVPAMPRIND